MPSVGLRCCLSVFCPLSSVLCLLSSGAKKELPESSGSSSIKPSVDDVLLIVVVSGSPAGSCAAARSTGHLKMLAGHVLPGLFLVVGQNGRGLVHGVLAERLDLLRGCLTVASLGALESFLHFLARVVTNR